MDPALLILCGITLFCTIDVVAAAKILFLFPIPFVSHYKAFSPLVEELANKGHQITAYTRFGRQRASKNYQEINISADTSNRDGKGVASFRKKSAIAYIHGCWNHFWPQTEAALRSQELQALIHSEEKFDLVMVEATFMLESLLAFGHKFNAPVVNLIPFFATPWMAQLAGIPHSYSYIPDNRLPYTDHMTFFQRLKNTLIGTYSILAGNYYYLPTQERMMRRYFNYSGSDTLPSLPELLANISLHLVNSHPLMSSVRPYSPNVIDVAGMPMKAAGKLPQDLQKFMDNATEGVIYVSFGVLMDASSFEKQFKHTLVETMKSVGHKVVMKWSEKIPGASAIVTKSWLPQQAILAHPNCKLFITHGGFNSLMEAMTNGVPTIGIPFFSDQYHNVAFYEQQGVGLEVNLETVTVAELSDKIKKIIRTPSFTSNAKRLAALYRDQPETSLEKAVYWVEYVIRHKGAHHLKPASSKMAYYQYLLLDVIAFLALLLFLALYIFYYSIIKITWFSRAKHISGIKKLS